MADLGEREKHLFRSTPNRRDRSMAIGLFPLIGGRGRGLCTSGHRGCVHGVVPSAATAR